jgi:hypothetical protein
MTQVNSYSEDGLVKLLEAIPRPRIPNGQNPELDKYHRNMDEFLRRLMGRFGAENLVKTILNNTDLRQFVSSSSNGFAVEVIKHFDVQNTNAKLVIDTNDWRYRGIKGVIASEAGDPTWVSSMRFSTIRAVDTQRPLGATWDGVAPAGDECIAFIQSHIAETDLQVYIEASTGNLYVVTNKVNDRLQVFLWLVASTSPTKVEVI